MEGFASFLLLFALALLLESDNSFLPNIISVTPLDSTLTLFSLITKFQTVSCILSHSDGCYHMCCPLSICLLRTETNLIFLCIALNWGTPTKKKPRFPSHQGEEIFYLWALNSSGNFGSLRQWFSVRGNFASGTSGNICTFFIFTVGNRVLLASSR